MTEKTYHVVAAGTAWIRAGMVIDNTAVKETMELHWQCCQETSSDDDVFYVITCADGSCAASSYDFDCALAASIHKYNTMDAESKAIWRKDK